jgi:hypothetical protein
MSQNANSFKKMVGVLGKNGVPFFGKTIKLLRKNAKPFYQNGYNFRHNR